MPQGQQELEVAVKIHTHYGSVYNILPELETKQNFLKSAIKIKIFQLVGFKIVRQLIGVA